MLDRILIVEDEPKIVHTLRLYLEDAGYQVLAAYDGTTALPMLRQERPAMVILDLNLPGRDGLDLCRSIRRESSVPIIMLTARSEEADRLVGLEVGADDYVVKPFSPREVVARVRAVMRRVTGDLAERGVLREGELLLDLPARMAWVGQAPLSLTRSEFEILAALARNAGRVMTRAQLLDETQGIAYDGYERNIDQHVKNLRRKLRQAASPSTSLVETVYGVGYRLRRVEEGAE